MKLIISSSTLLIALTLTYLIFIAYCIKFNVVFIKK